MEIGLCFAEVAIVEYPMVRLEKGRADMAAIADGMAWKRVFGGEGGFAACFVRFFCPVPLWLHMDHTC
jgi:hypothetical protein